MCILQVIHHCLKNSHHNIIKFSMFKIGKCNTCINNTSYRRKMCQTTELTRVRQWHGLTHIFSNYYSLVRNLSQQKFMYQFLNLHLFCFLNQIHQLLLTQSSLVYRIRASISVGVANRSPENM